MQQNTAGLIHSLGMIVNGTRTALRQPNPATTSALPPLRWIAIAAQAQHCVCTAALDKSAAAITNYKYVTAAPHRERLQMSTGHQAAHEK
jgi:hypothetical protein